MKRNSFLKFCLAAGTLLTAPFAAIGKLNNRKRVDKGIVVEAGKDRFNKPLTVFEGDKFYSKVSGKDTDGDLFIWESTREKKGGPPLHYHVDVDEWWYVLEGEFLFQVGDEKFNAKKGDSVFGPRMVPHAFAKSNDGSAKLIQCFQPVGKMEYAFKFYSEGLVEKMTEEERKAFNKEIGVVYVGQSLLFDKTKYH